MTNDLCLLERYKITPNELMFIRSLLLLQEDSNSELFKRYFNILRNCNINIRDLIISLQEKGVINKSYKIPNIGLQLDPYEIPMNKTFTKTIFKASFIIGKELFEVYPQFATINGNLVGIRTIAKKFDSLEDAYFRYGKEIKWNPEKHSQIIELIEWSKEHNLLNCSLASFIINNGWNDLEALKNGEGNINYDNVRIL